MIEYDDFNSVSPVSESSAPADRLERNPLITEEGFKNFLRLKQHPRAPVWNFETGDRIVAEDLPDWRAFRDMLDTSRVPQRNAPAPQIIRWIKALRPRVFAFQKRLPEGFDIERDWAEIPTLEREDVATRIETIVPVDADLKRLIVFDTSGSTGHALAVPTHPAALGKVLAMIEFALERHGVKPSFGPDTTACLNVGIQANAVIFPNVMSLWNQAGFAKLNLNPESWRAPRDMHSFFSDTAPSLITGDPAAFSELVRRKIRATPAAMPTTALKLPRALKEKVSAFYGCPVIDWYSTTETGPVGYACPYDNGFHILPHDIFVEILDERGYPVPEGATGEIAVTGGRNPYLPLLRYRTGDTGALDFSPCPCGDPMPRIVCLDGREPVMFFADNDRAVNPVDVGRLLRSFVMTRYRFVQRTDRSCDLTIRPVAPGHSPNIEKMKERLALLFGENTPIRIRLDGELDEKMKEDRTAVYENAGWDISRL
jgi:phenylacetate-CoA ligase